MPERAGRAARPASPPADRARSLQAQRAAVQRLPLPPAPSATYRVQFHAGFGFDAARRLVGYLHDLGVSHLYASPYLRARSGSTHGYDVADPNALNPELGTGEEYAQLVAELRAHGMGQLVDVVPNHMGIGDPGNVRWLDVLENGPSSVYAPFFDINWSPLKAEPRDHNRLILPTLGDQYGNVLEAGELALGYADGAFFIRYYDRRFPVAPDTYPLILAECLDTLQDELGRRHEQVQELASILTAIRHLPPRGGRDPAALEERNREKEIVKRRLRLLYAESPPLRAALQRALQALNGTPGDRASFDRLDALLEQQSYRLAFWRVAAEEINYRRFFDISELAAVRMEDPAVFHETHRLLLRLVREGTVSGLRIDHPDGLRDPARYLWQLQRSCLAHFYAGRLDAAGPASATGAGGPATPAPTLEEELGALVDRELRRRRRSPREQAFYVVVEKILGGEEELPAAWPVHGTTGYDFLNAAGGLFVNRENGRAFHALYTRFIRQDLRYRDLANSAKKMAMLISLASEVNELGYELKRIASVDRRRRDFTLNLLSFAIREVIAALPVYRTYIDPETGAASQTDRVYVESAVAEAKRRNPRTDPSIFDFIRGTLLGPANPAPVPRASDAEGTAGGAPPESEALRLQFIAPFQQTTGPVMAKGVEDTAFYVYNRLLALNEVGGEPDRFGTSITAFHRQNQRRARAWPTALLATSTHDTKRSEDVRARIAVLSELPREWRAALTRWSRLNGRKKHSVDGRQAPDRNEEYLLYQTLLGAWPLEPLDAGQYATFRDRIAAAMLKSVKEAKVNTSWINPNAAYEAAVQQFVHAILDTGAPNPFLEDFHALRERVAFFGLFNALSQTLLKLTSPGVPDIYQGNEVWDFSLVDPDNRRPVDYARRMDLLRSLRRASTGGVALRPFARGLLETLADGRIKLWLTHRALRLRQDCPELFGRGSYVPLRAAGPKKRHVCAFARVWEGQRVIVVAPVLLAGLTRATPVPPMGREVWGETSLHLPGAAGETFRDIFTGATIQAHASDGRLGLADLLADFPVAALVATPEARR